MTDQSGWSSLKDMPYNEFGKLQFREFFPMTGRYHRDEEDACGGVEIPGLGLACSEGYLDTYFGRLEDSRATATIELSFGRDCPESQGNALLAKLGLNICKGMSYADLKRSLGAPVMDFGPPETRDGATELLYIVGLQWPYYVRCVVEALEGLSSVWIARRDLVDRFEQWRSSL